MREQASFLLVSAESSFVTIVVSLMLLRGHVLSCQVWEKILIPAVVRQDATDCFSGVPEGHGLNQVCVYGQAASLCVNPFKLVGCPHSAFSVEALRKRAFPWEKVTQGTEVAACSLPDGRRAGLRWS